MTQGRGSTDAEPGLSIGDLAEGSGLSPAVLRMWETRYGFPEPHRLPSGHRRYSTADLEAVRAVMRRKSAGVRLETAIAEFLASRQPDRPSIFGALRERHPDLVVTRLHKRTLVALSHGIEDECAVAADHPVLFGAFQTPAFYAQSAARWRDLARYARAAVVFAAGWETSTDETESPLRVRLGDDALLRREWVLICEAPDSHACLAAWELPGQADVPDSRRVFETVWTVDPEVVRDAARIALGIAEVAGLRSSVVRESLDALPPTSAPSPQASMRLFRRVLAYVDRD